MFWTNCITWWSIYVLNKTSVSFPYRSQCPVCPKNYHKNFTKVTNHIKAVHLNVKKKCKICQEIVSFSEYATHVEAHGNEIKCDLCDYTTKLKRNLNKHLWQIHTKR